MKRSDTLTMIVTRNYGRSHTFSLPTWKVYVGGTLSAAVVGLLVLLGLAFLVLYPQFQQTRRDLRQLEQERDALRQQVLSANQEAFQAKDRLAAAEESSEPRRETQDVVPASINPADSYSPPIRIGAINTRLTRNHLEFSFQLTSQDRGRSNRGGFVFTVFENQDATPTAFAVSPAASTNESGFPQFYKEGLIFPRVVESVHIRRSIRLETHDTYFSHVTVYLFTPRGGLIAKERFQLDRSVFQLDPGAESRKPAKA